MKITKEIVDKIVNLSRIETTENEKENILKSFGPILEMIDQVNEVELSDEVERNFRLKNIMREDKVQDNISKNRDEIIALFPNKQGDYLKTKKILSN